MSRSVPYRRNITDLVNYNQLKAEESTLFILKNIGPVGYIIQEENTEESHKVLIGDPHFCSCKKFHKEKDLCKHICWILLKKFKLNRNDPMTWQAGLVHREIEEILYNINSRILVPAGSGEAEHASQADINKNNITEEDQTPATAEQRSISAEDICPICQEEFLKKLLQVTYCKVSCGNNIHIRCMRVWADHQRKQLKLSLTDNISCPICRGPFGTMQEILRQVHTTGTAGPNLASSGGDFAATKTVIHRGTECALCKVSPIEGNLYKCVECVNYVICNRCFQASSNMMQSGSHRPPNTHKPTHNVVFRETRNGRWQETPKTKGLPLTLLNSMQRRDLRDEDMELINQIEDTSANPTLTQKDIARLPSRRLSETSKILKSSSSLSSSSTSASSTSASNSTPSQCRLCLMFWRPGDHLRRLPACNHQFHSRCIDPWLQHQKAACPLCALPVTGLDVRQRRPGQSTPSEMAARRESTPTVDSHARKVGSLSLLQIAGQNAFNPSSSESTDNPQVDSHMNRILLGKRFSRRKLTSSTLQSNSVGQENLSVNGSRFKQQHEQNTLGNATIVKFLPPIYPPSSS